MERTALQKIVFFTLPALLISNAAFAHDEIPTQVLEGNTVDAVITMAHACEMTPTGIPVPVIAQSVLFPAVNPVLTASNGSTTITNLSQVIEQGSLAGLIDTIQNHDIFTVKAEKHDTLGNVTGFHSKTGSLAIDAQGRVPFAFTAPNFVPTSCVKKLNIEVAIADICTVSKPTISAAKVNLWIPNNGSQYALKGITAGVDGVGDPAVLQVNRNLASNPLPSSCGAGIDLTVSPSPTDVDTNLGIPGYWSK